MCGYAVFVMIAFVAISAQGAIIRLPTPSSTAHAEIDQPTNETVIDPSILNVLSTELSNLFALKDHENNATSNELADSNGSLEGFKVVETVIVDNNADKSTDQVKVTKPKSLISNYQNAVVHTEYIGNYGKSVEKSWK